MTEYCQRSKASPARKAAVHVVRLTRERKAFASELIASHIDRAGLATPDRAFATRLVLGVVATVGTLDEVIDRSLRSPTDIKDDVRDALRISCYEILFLDKSSHAAVDQGVELVRYVAPKAAGLANAVLRKILSAKEQFPFGDPETDDAALARQYAFPFWLAKLLIADLGRREACLFMEASNQPAPLFIGVNRIKANDEAVGQAFRDAQASVSDVVLAGRKLQGCLHVAEGSVLQHPAIAELFSTGKILVSDAASQLVAEQVLPEAHPASFLEIGAGRGTKTVLLQSNAVRRWGRQMTLSALDSHRFKTDLLRKRAELYDVQLEQLYALDATKLDEGLGKASFDALFIDAPCSGLGTLRRHPEIRWRLKPDDVKALADLGLAMLTSASRHVAAGGSLAYATCTVTHIENDMLIARFLKSEAGAGFRLSDMCGQKCIATRLEPGSSDAHFAVRLVRTR